LWQAGKFGQLLSLTNGGIRPEPTRSNLVGEINAFRRAASGWLSQAFGLSPFISKGSADMHPVSLAAKLATFTEHWQPRTITQFNGHDIMVVKAQGEFVWHKHDETDDFFLVLKGHLTIELRECKVQLGPGELFVVPKGMEHRPVAHEEVHLLLIEPTGTPNTGTAATAAARRVI
jgi:mannose-6-phosphate isomerase-like protein (cupin superfamily)